MDNFLWISYHVFAFKTSLDIHKENNKERKKNLGKKLFDILVLFFIYCLTSNLRSLFSSKNVQGWLKTLDITWILFQSYECFRDIKIEKRKHSSVSFKNQIAFVTNPKLNRKESQYKATRMLQKSQNR